jgi:hypothetical protein
LPSLSRVTSFPDYLPYPFLPEHNLPFTLPCGGHIIA